MMLPTPDTSHVPYSRVYEPAEDSFLYLDTLSSPSEKAFLQARFAGPNTATPLVVEVGPGSGVVIAFVAAQAQAIFATPVLTIGIDVNAFACTATAATVRKAAPQDRTSAGLFLGAMRGDLLRPLRARQVDVLLCNPPYVPTDALPALPVPDDDDLAHGHGMSASARWERDSYLLSLSYAGGKQGTEVTDRLITALPGMLSARGCAYLLLCAGNNPEEVKARIRGFGPDWQTLTVGDSGKQAGCEKLQIIRVWRDRAAQSHSQA